MTCNLCNAVVSTSPVSQPTPCSPTADATASPSTLDSLKSRSMQPF